jgi:hypothetical protein
MYGPNALSLIDKAVKEQQSWSNEEILPGYQRI